jgi:hypothetical protein
MRADAEAIPQFQRAFRADRARAVADPVRVIQQHHGMATLGQIDRQRQANRACADHHHRMARGIRRPCPDRDGGDSRTE